MFGDLHGIPSWLIFGSVIVAAGVVVIPTTIALLSRASRQQRLSHPAAAGAGTVVGALSLGGSASAYIAFMRASGSWSSMSVADVIYPAAIGAVYGLCVAVIWRALHNRQ